MNIRDIYRKETGKEPYNNNPSDPLVREFFEEYVKWLEHKIKEIPELLKK